MTLASVMSQGPRFRLHAFAALAGVELRNQQLVRNAMKLPMPMNRQGSVRVSARCSRQRPSARDGSESGQSMLEMTFGVAFLAIVVLILFEMAVLYYSYIALLNASREGAVFAATHPTMEAGDSDYERFERITTAEAVEAGLVTEPGFFEIHPPEKPEGVEPLDPIIVRVSYQLINPTQGVILPFLGRMGLFQSAWMTASTEMPIQ